MGWKSASINCLAGLAMAVTAVGGPSPNWVEAPLDDDFHPPLGTYEYRVDAGGNVAKASITIAQEDDLYRVTVRARTNKFIDKIYKLRYEGDTTLDLARGEPVKTVIRSQENKRKDTTEIRFGQDGVIDTVETKERKGKDTKTKSHSVQVEEPTIDPFSIALLARGVPWAVGHREAFHVITGKDRYRVVLECVAREKVQLGLEKRLAWAIDPQITPLDEKKKRKKSPVKSVRLYVAAEGPRDFLGIWAEAFFGEIVVRLTGFTPEEGSPTRGG